MLGRLWELKITQAKISRNVPTVTYCVQIFGFYIIIQHLERLFLCLIGTIYLFVVFKSGVTIFMASLLHGLSFNIKIKGPRLKRKSKIVIIMVKT